MTFRDALPTEAAAITQVVLASKRHWGYPEEWMAIFTEELTVSAEDIVNNKVVVAEENSDLCGVTMVKNTCTPHKAEIYLLFIHPAYINKGIGKRLLTIALDWCKTQQKKQVYLEADPNARGFYEKMGGVYGGEIEFAPIPGRTLPIFVFEL